MTRGRDLAAAARGPLGPPATAPAPGRLGSNPRLDAVGEADQDRLFAARVGGIWPAAKAVRRGKRGRGRGAIVTSGPGAGLAANTVFPAYGAAAAVVIDLTRSSAAAHAGADTRADRVRPGPIKTPLLREGLDGAGAGAAGRGAWTRARNPMARGGTPREAAAVIAFLARAGAPCVPGQVTGVDGGRLAARPPPTPAEPGAEPWT